MSPLPKTPQRGDQARLEQLASGLKQQGGTHGPLLQRNDAGRPTGTTGTPAPRASQNTNMPEGFEDSVRELATSEALRTGWSATAEYWEGMYAESPTPYVKMMRDMAVHMAQQHDNSVTRAAARVYTTTPNLEA